MSNSILGLVAAALLVSVTHGALPNHWAPFVLVGKAQNWTAKRMLWVLTMAGIAHTAVAGGLALGFLLLGTVVTGWIKGWVHLLPGLIMLGAGVIYIALDLFMGHKHSHHHGIENAGDQGMTDRSATVTLILMLAISPCEAMIPVFIGATPMGDPIFLAGLVVLSGVVSLIVMGSLALLTWHGLKKLSFGWFARHERLTMGIILALVGILTLFLGHSHHSH